MINKGCFTYDNCQGNKEIFQKLKESLNTFKREYFNTNNLILTTPYNIIMIHMIHMNDTYYIIYVMPSIESLNIVY